MELLQQFSETGKAKRVGSIKPRADNPTSVSLTSLYFLLTPDADILPIGTTNAILNSFVTQYLSDSEHLSSPPLKRLFGGLE
jgi:hypothetical protein